MLPDDHDSPQISKAATILKKLDCIDAQFVESESDELYQKQPFILSLFLGYKDDVSPEELEEIMKLIFLIWEFYKGNDKLHSNKLTEDRYERIHMRNIHMLNYHGGALSEMEKAGIAANELEHIRSKALYSAVISRFNESIALVNMDGYLKGVVIIGMKVLIECLDEIVYT